jgi:ribosomal protein S13
MSLSIFGCTLPAKKKVVYSLSKLYGIGVPCAQKICRKLALLPTLKIIDLTDTQQYNLVKLIVNNINTLKKIHPIFNLPSLQAIADNKNQIPYHEGSTILFQERNLTP